MVTVYEVPPDRLINEMSKKLKEMDHIELPEWGPFVKTGVHKEKAPVQEDWWFTRVAAIYRTVYVEGPIGVSRLKGIYGGKQNRNSKPSRAAKGSGSIVRHALQQLEAEGLVGKKDEGRVVSPEGRSLLDNTSYDIMKEMAADNPELSKYL